MIVPAKRALQAKVVIGSTDWHDSAWKPGNKPLISPAVPGSALRRRGKKPQRAKADPSHQSTGETDDDGALNIIRHPDASRNIPTPISLDPPAKTIAKKQEEIRTEAGSREESKGRKNLTGK
jgi:hypothetical protein